MKRSLLLLVQYFIFILLGCLLGIFVYTQFYNNINLVAGFPVKFSKYPLIKGFLESIPIILLLIGMLLSLYKVRHMENPVSSAIVYSCLGIITWFLVFPASLSLIKVLTPVTEKIAESEIKSELSRGYFRKVGNVYYYFLEEQRGDITQVIAIDSNQNTFGIIKQLDLSADSEFNKQTQPFVDPIIKASLDNIPYRIIKVFSNVKKNAMSAWNNGYISWLLFCSLGFALWSIYGLIKISSWKLINTFMIIFFQGLIILFNGIYFSSRFELLHDLIPPVKSIPVSELLLAIVNVSVGILFITVGIISTCVKKREY